MKRIYLIRHGKQNTNLFNADKELSDIGRKQAILLRDRLRTCTYDKIYSSTLLRAIETSNILNENWNMDIERRSELNEIDYGSLTGDLISSSNDTNKEFFDLLNSRIADTPFPAGENGEMAFTRAFPVFKEIEKSQYKSILVVCHGGLIRSIICGLLGIPFNKRLALSKYLENTSISELLYNEDSNLYYIERLNDYTHLLPFPELRRKEI